MLALQAGHLEILGDVECVKLLRSHDLGRIGLVDRQARPLIFPVNYFFDEGVVVFRTAPGTKLGLAPGAYVSFEIDSWDPDGGTGWSVLVKGIAHDITNPRGAPTGRMRFWPVQPMAPGTRQHWVGIWANEITGRKFRSDAQGPRTRKKAHAIN
ncbi:MAG TPA: pyridoxamine 5'-phosphate oxidase family protein [Candidatus Nitrosotalea sp.]|nr:pyridoxamine 5'-phosphate oxidase family protein [Candidatus Nitrosotalea sp.]